MGSVAEISHRCENRMSIAEARGAIEAIKGHVDSVRGLVLDLHRREGWAALGYPSWRACVAAEFGQHQATLYRQLQAAIIEEEILDGEPLGQIPARQLRAMADVPAGQRKGVWGEVVGEAGSRPTARQVEAVVDRKLGREPAPRPTPKAAPKPAPRPEPAPARDDPDADEPPDLLADDGPSILLGDDREAELHRLEAEVGGPMAVPAGRSIVNGVEQDDPPEIAESRRKGAIPAGVVPVVETNDPVPLLPPSREPGEDDDATDDVDEWVETLPLYRRLSDRPHKLFVHAAKLHWRLRAAREAARVAVGEALRGLTHDNELAYHVKAWLRIGDPRYWSVCPPTAEGGCDGLGQIPGIDEKCPLCRGRGFRCREA